MKSFYSYTLSSCPNVLAFYNTIRPKQSIVLYSGNERGRYSFVMLEPEYYAYYHHHFSDIETIFQKAACQKDMHSLIHWNIPFSGGVAGLIPYENSSCAVIGQYDRFFVEDTLTKKCFLAGWFESEDDANTWAVFYQQQRYQNPSCFSVSLSSPFLPQWTTDEYRIRFIHCQKEIEKGNSFQINLSQKFTAQTDSRAWDIFVMATKQNTASMMAFWQDSEHAVISCSPERLFLKDSKGNILTQPIGGTRKRGHSPEQEEILENDLKTSRKENAEHSMLVDLLRNDFGKVARFGSVHVSDFARIEKYASVMHLVSDIWAVLDSKKSVFDLFEALFPGGTITGTPKQETMKILQTQEQEPRDMYCGSAFYCSYSGFADASIMIRTLQKKGNDIWGRAGGGVVMGADAMQEYEETRAKFAGLEKIF